MPMVYIKKNLYDKIANVGLDPAKIVNKLLEKYLEEMSKSEPSQGN